MNRPCLITGTFLLAGLLATVAGNAATGEPSSASDSPIIHPLLDASLPDGRVPVLDVKDAPSGRRFAVEEASVSPEEGQVTESSGVVELGQRRPTPGELQEMWEEKLEANHGQPPASDDRPSAKIGRPLQAALAAAPPGQRLPVLLRVAEPPLVPSSIEEIERAIGRGEVRTTSDVRAKRAELIQRRRELVARAQDPVVSAIAQLGAEVTARHHHLFGLGARLTPSQVQQLARLPEVERMDLAGVGADDINGQHMARGTQITQFINAGYAGENGAGTDITFAVIESTELHDDHVGFRDTSSSSSPRIRVRYECDSSSCNSTSNFTSPGDHSTAVNAIVFGDLRDGQDSSITDSLERQEKSGYADEARGYVYATGYDTSAKREALDDVIGRTYTPHVVNMSWSDYNGDTQCEGDTALAKDANDLFEEGLLLVKSAGNTPGSSTDCTIGSPGAAIGVFTVGGHGNSSTSSDYLEVETASIYSNSGMGGVTSSEGINRSIVDVTAYACREDLFDTSGGYAQSGCGTSYSTPTVTAAAVDHVDFYTNYKSNLIDNPGILFAHLLVMGDREGQSGSLTTGTCARTRRAAAATR